MNDSRIFGKIPSTQILPEHMPFEPELALSRNLRKMNTRKLREYSFKEESLDQTERTIIWHADTSSAAFKPTAQVEKKPIVKEKGVFETLVKYFSWTQRTKGLTRIPKFCFTLIYILVVPAVFGGLFGTHLASLLLLINQSKFSNSYKATNSVLETFASGEEIRVSRDDCPLVSARDIGIFLSMNDNFPQIIAIASFGISASLVIIILLSKATLKKKKMATNFYIKLIVVIISTLCLCKTALILIMFYFPMHSFSQLLGNFLVLQNKRCFSTSLGDSVTTSLTEFEDQFSALKIWMWVDLGSICGIMLFPCIKFFASWLSCTKKMKKSL